ncbi:MAG TPA: carbohydrate ABC transporter permease [Mycobacteriales bacterium]|nr:carbohydrate ABC transporter permease [Mycobacteriales bacterium]
MTALAAPPATAAAPAPPAGARRRRLSTRPPRTGLYVPRGLYLLFTLVPFYWMLMYALRPAGRSGVLPWPLTLEHFRTVWTGLGFGIFFRNSVLVGLVTLCFVTVLALMGGYALARFRFRGDRLFLVLLLCTQFMPGVTLLIPLFILFRQTHLINNLASLVIAESAFQLPLALVLMSSFVRNVPVELEEAAMVDGCSRLRAFFAVVLPQLRPGIVAVGSFAFIGSWNNFLFALMFISDQDRFTIPVGLSYTLGEYNVDFGALAAGGVVAAVPVVCVFAVIQRFLVQGLSAGAVKG